jgi:hypothetical protein
MCQTGVPPVDRFGSWVQIASSILVVAGLSLVLIELQQSKKLAQAQLASDSMTLLHDAAVALAGEEPAEVISRVCESSNPISLEDALVLSGIYQQYLSRILRAMEVDQIAGFQSNRWEQVARINLAAILMMPGGRDWLDAISFEGSPGLKRILGEIEPRELCDFRGARPIQESFNQKEDT